MPASVQQWRQARRICGALAKIEKKKSKRKSKRKSSDDRDRSGGGCVEARTFQSLA
jgi:hypothetical protein